jgi:NTE family protein
LIRIRRCHKRRVVCILALMTAIISCTPRGVRLPTGTEPAKIALVLGAGASRGFAHVGVVKVLEMNKVPIHIVVGTSAGSVIGSLYAYGNSAFKLQEMALSIEKGDIIDPLIVPTNGFIKGDKLEEFINKALKNTTIDKLKIPFYAVATDIQSGQEFLFSRGNTGAAVRASCAIPGVFRPVKIGDRMYVDGGMVSPVAVDAARKLGANVVIAVDISSALDRTQPEATMETIVQSINIMYAKLAAVQLCNADVVIRPKVGHIASFDFAKRHEAILEGEKATIEVLPQIMDLLKKLKQEGRLG